MNVMSAGLVRSLGLVSRSLIKVGFQGLLIRIADYRDTVLQY